MRLCVRHASVLRIALRSSVCVCCTTCFAFSCSTYRRHCTTCSHERYTDCSSSTSSRQSKTNCRQHSSQHTTANCSFAFLRLTIAFAVRTACSVCMTFTNGLCLGLSLCHTLAPINGVRQRFIGRICQLLRSHWRQLAINRFIAISYLRHNIRRKIRSKNNGSIPLTLHR